MFNKAALGLLSMFCLVVGLHAGLDDGLVAHITVEQAYLEHISNTTPTNTDTTTVVDTCTFRESADFDGSTSTLLYASMTDIAFATTDFSLSFWAYRDSLSTSQEHMIWYREGSSDATGYSVDWDSSGDLVFRIDFGTLAEEVYVDQPAVDTWHHYAVTVDRDGDMVIYADGAEADRYTLTSSASIASTNDDLRLGVGLDSAAALNNYSESRLDNLRFYNRLLTTWEVSKLFETEALESRSVITQDLTLTVDSAYADIQAALACLAGKRIAPNATVTIQVEDGTYTAYDTITIDHPDGSNIHLIGNTTTPANVNLVFASGTDALVVSRGNQLGLIDGFTLTGAASSPGDGMVVRHNASVVTGPNLVLEDFDNGILVTASSAVTCDDITITDCDSHGIKAADGSFIQAKDITISGCNAGARAETTSGINMESMSITSCYQGLSAAGNSYIKASGGSLTNSTSYGSVAIYSSHIYLKTTTFTGNGGGNVPVPNWNAIGNYGSWSTK